MLKIEQFYSALLNNRRDLFVYLPPGYGEESGRRYPVLYVHDGQNIFHPAFNGYSWNLHETADRLVQNGLMEEIIIVGIANMGMQRSDEFTHELEGVDYLRDKVDIRPIGQLYEQFITDELMPYIDSLFRTKKGPEHTAMMGSSRGGQVTYHIGMRRPDLFGKLAILSPYFYCVDPVTLEEERQYHTWTDKVPLSRIWIDLGSCEGTLILEKHVREATESLLQLGYKPDEELVYYLDPTGTHSEKDWAARVASPLLHMFGVKGAPAKLSLEGEEIAGIRGPEMRLNPIAEFDSGFKMSLLRADYAAEDGTILEVREDGTLVPGREGETVVKVSYGGLSATRSIRVAGELKEHVTLELLVHVPADTPETAVLYSWISLRREAGEPGLYSARLTVPLNAAFEYRISRGDGAVEADQAGQAVTRFYKAEADGRLELTVHSWKNPR
ncbi:alpha/beta hydrolase [Paenibacillus chitinolyticus]|uniref:alpha/beta hydrolase n=1 Tax=Paenibacillus chitinolyticus TaxID=79263 RepID=UPI002DBA61BD|nr:alpha/beta hydrolase-fold protein [Paenibacillus chitinolyticus]